MEFRLIKAILFFCTLFSQGALAASPVSVKTPIEFKTLLARMSDSSYAAEFRDFSSHLISSYDRSGGNEDWGNYQAVEGATAVLADIEGPGAVTRIWSPNPDLAGKIRIYLDGNPDPVVEASFKDFISGKISPFVAPLVARSSGAYISFFPIPFQRRCKIVVDYSKTFYYQVGYIKFGDEIEVKTLGLPLSNDEQAAVVKLTKEWSHPRAHAAAVAKLRQAAESYKIADGATTEVAALVGPARIESLALRIASSEKRKLILRAYFDGHHEPDIEAPVADLFGDPFFGKGAESYFTGVQGDIFILSLPMPFAKSARFTLENGSGQEVNVKIGINAVQTDFDPQRFGYLHARFLQERTKKGAPHNWLNVRGDRGHLAGVVQTMAGRDFWILEGDDVIRRDDERWLPSSNKSTKIAPWNGTGAEDYFNSGWYYADGVFHQPFHGAVVRDETGLTATYRWHGLDAPNFSYSIDALIEHGGTNDVPNNYFSSLVFWYSAGESYARATMPEASQLQSPGLFKVPPGNGKVVTVQGESLKVVDWSEGKSLMMGGQILLAGPNARPVKLAFNLAANDTYTFKLHAARRANFGSLRVKVDGKYVSKDLALDSRSDAYEAVEFYLGKLRLAAGSHILEIESVIPSKQISLTGFSFESTSPLLSSWRLSPVYPNSKDQSGFDAIFPPESNPINPPMLNSWSSAKPTSSGWINLATQIKPNEYSVVYALNEVHSKSAFVTDLLLGYDDSAKVWLNGKLIHSNPTLGGLLVDQHKIPIRLNEGRNIILLKIPQGLGGWSFAARIVDPNKILSQKSRQ